MSRLTRSSLAIGGVIAVFGAGAAAVGASSGRHDSGVVYFAVTHIANGKQYVAGQASDKLFGKEAVTYVLKVSPGGPKAALITAKPVKIYFANGTLTGTATAQLTPGPGGTATITNGKLKASHGTGAQAGHSETAKFHGTGSTTTGQYKITYSGVYR